MILQQPPVEYDPFVKITDVALIEKLGDAALIGKWFVFLKTGWFERSGMDRVLATAGIAEVSAKAAILFRGKDEIALPGVNISPTPLPRPKLVSHTADKALYRANRDTVHLLIASPQQPGADLKLRLHLSGNPYAQYTVTLDEYGLCLWSMQGLPEGEYEARLEGNEAEACRFEVAEYRLAPLNAELIEQHLSGETLHYALAVTVFGQPYVGPVEVELQERGQRIGTREKLVCNSDGVCRGVAKLSGVGPYTLNIFAGERTATVALKGSEQVRRETLVISELGEEHELSLLPFPPARQSNACRGMFIARGGSNSEPFLVRRVIGSDVEITSRTGVELLRVVVVDPARAASEEKLCEHLQAGQSIHLPIPTPYGIVLLGAFVDGNAWEGWCAMLHPAELQLQCEAPKQAQPGSRINVTLKTGKAERAIPVQLVVKDQRLIASSDPEVELAACIKQNLGEWHEQSHTGEADRQLAQLAPKPVFSALLRANGPTMMRPLAAGPMATPGTEGAFQFASAQQQAAAMVPGTAQPVSEPVDMARLEAVEAHRARQNVAVSAQTDISRVLAKMRLQFPEVIYNNIVKVQGETSVEIKLGDSMTRYSIEAFALSPETLDWQRVETTVDAVQPVYGELTVSPFVLPGDPVMGRLDVGAASGDAIVEVRHENEVLPLFFDNGEAVTPGLPIPSGSVLRFPVRPGAITSIVRDAREGGRDVSERYVTVPGQLRHIVRRVRILTPGEEVTAKEPRVLEIRPMPGLERPFQFFVENAARYPFGCIEQTSSKLLAMFAGYITNEDQAEVAREYEGALLAWHKRLRSMYLPRSGFCLYPPEEGGASKPDTHYAPLGVKHLLNLPTAARSGVKSKVVRELLDDIAAMTKDAAAYYKIANPPKTITDCQAAYLVIAGDAKQRQKDEALAFVRTRLVEHNGQTYAAVPEGESSQRWLGKAVLTRAETAYAAAALLRAGEPGDLPRAIAATNYLTGQLNEEGRLYSTVDTAACLALLLSLRDAGLVTTADGGRLQLNGQEMALADALTINEKIDTLHCIEGIIAVQVTSEVTEDWSAYKNELPLEVHLERKGQVQHEFQIGDELELVIRVSRYEPGLIVHVCLPDALARIVGGGQVKRFSLDFCGKNELHVPLAAVGTTALPAINDEELSNNLLRWLGVEDGHGSGKHTQHWAVLVRNMFKEEQVGNPGLLEAKVR